MVDLQELIKKILEFRDEHAWQKTNNSKDLALALTTEAVELHKLFHWHRPYAVMDRKLRKELADVFIYALLLLHSHGYDLEEIINDKLTMDNAKYQLQS
jgi:NTP pyrophosphatase (non-canonical NTP hydrolase)